MTTEELRELDKQIAEKVFGQVWEGGNPIANYDGRWPWPAPYSTDIRAAWEIVEKLHGRGIYLHVGHNWCDAWDKDLQLVGVTAESSPIAICISALKAVAKE